MKNKTYLDRYDEFAAASFDHMEVFVLQLFQNAQATGMTNEEAHYAVKTFLTNRFKDSRYLDSMIDHAELINFVYPGARRDDISC